MVRTGINCAGDSTTIGGVAAGEGNLIGGNFIGTGSDGAEDFGNLGCGISALSHALDSTIGPDNIIAFNNQDGIRVSDDTTFGITLSQNSIFNNAGLGINTQDGGNLELAPPVISTVSDDQIAGTSFAGATVEIFSDNEDEGRIFEGSVSASAAGDFVYEASLTGPNITATATDASGNTSEFSLVALISNVGGFLPKPWGSMVVLSPNYPNPFNPQTNIEYTLPAAGQMTLRVLDIRGRVVRLLVAGYQPAGTGSVQWNGDDKAGKMVPSGLYFAELRFADEVQVRKMTVTK